MKKLKIGALALVLLLISSNFIVTAEEEAETKETNKIEEKGPKLQLTNQEVVVKYEESLDPQDLIVAGYWEQLQLPKVDTTTLGAQTLHFIAENHSGQVRSSMTINVIDDVPPVFDESIEKVTIDYDEKIDLLSYFEASDNTGEEVSIKADKEVNITKSGTQTILITATDNSGNSVDQEVKVTVKEKPIPIYYPTVSGETPAIVPGESISARMTMYGVDCYGCRMNSSGVGSTASGVQVSLDSVRQPNGVWQPGITYGGRYIVAAGRQYPFGTLVDIYNHGYVGSGITLDQPIRAIVLDRGGGVSGNHFDLFVGSERVPLAYHARSTSPRAVIVGVQSNYR